MSVTIREQSEQLKAAAAERCRPTWSRCSTGASRTCSTRASPPRWSRSATLWNPSRLSDATGAPVTPGPARRGRPGRHRLLPGRLVPVLQPGAADLPAGTAPAAGCLRRPAGGHQPPVTRPVALHRREGRARLHRAVRPGQPRRPAIGIVFQQADEVLDAQRKLGLDLAQVNAEGSTRLPRPTVLIVDQDRTVRFVDVQPDYTARTEVADILAALTDLP